MRDNYEATNNDFWDTAWKDMQGRLDAEMPPKRKRPVLVWWLAGAAVALLLFAIIEGYYSQPALDHFRVPLRGIAAREPLEPTIPTVAITSTALTDGFDPRPAMNRERTMTPAAHWRAKVTNPIAKRLPAPVASEIKLSPKIVLSAKAAIQEPTEPLVTLPLKAFTTGGIHQTPVPSGLFKRSRLALELIGGGWAQSSPDVGYYLGLGGQYQLNKRWQFGLALTYEQQRASLGQQLGIPYSPTFEDSGPVGPGSQDPDSSVGSSTSADTLVLDGPIRSRRLAIGALTHYRISSRLSFGLGFRYSYLLDVAYAPNNVSDDADLMAERFSFSNTGQGLAIDGNGILIEPNQRWVPSMELGAQYRLNRRLGIDISYRAEGAGWLPERIRTIRNGQWTLGLRYRLF